MTSAQSKPLWQWRALEEDESGFPGHSVFSLDQGWQTWTYRCLVPSAAQFLATVLNEHYGHVLRRGRSYKAYDWLADEAAVFAAKEYAGRPKEVDQTIY